MRWKRMCEDYQKKKKKIGRYPLLRRLAIQSVYIRSKEIWNVSKSNCYIYFIFFVCFNIFYSKKEWLSFLCVDMGMLGWIMLKSRVS